MATLKSAKLKAEKGLISVKLYTENSKIKELRLEGDFFFYPEDKLWELENALVGMRLDKEKLREEIARFYSENNILSPGVKPKDFAEAIIMAHNQLAKD